MCIPRIKVECQCTLWWMEKDLFQSGSLRVLNLCHYQIFLTFHWLGIHFLKPWSWVPFFISYRLKKKPSDILYILKVKNPSSKMFMFAFCRINWCLGFCMMWWILLWGNIINQRVVVQLCEIIISPYYWLSLHIVEADWTLLF